MIYISYTMNGSNVNIPIIDTIIEKNAVRK